MDYHHEQSQSLLQRQIADVLAKRVSDPRIVGMVSVTQVKISPDFHEAQVWVSILPEKYEKRTINGLRHAAGYIHGLVKKQVALRSVPRLDFRLDHSLKEQAQVHAAINQAVQRTEQSEGS